MPAPRARTLAGLAGTLAAVIWASYYILLILLPGVAGTMVVVLPFAVAAVAFLLWHPDRTHGGSPRILLERLATPTGLCLGALFLALQVDVVLATRWAGAVDASLVTLLADVVATPLIVFGLFRQDTERFRSWAFWGGVAVASIGAAGTIVAGGSGEALTRAGILSLLPLPFLIGFYFVWVNEESRHVSSGEVLGAAALAAALLGAVLGSVLFGPSWALTSLTPPQWLALVVMGLTTFYLAPFAYFWAARKTSILVPAVLQALIPVFTLLMVALLGYHFPWIAWLGVPLAFLGSAIAVLSPVPATGEAHPTAGPS